MAPLWDSPPPSDNNAHGDEILFKANMKRSPRCMQIDLLPLIASNISMATTARSPHGAERAHAEISPAVWDEKLGLWTRDTKMAVFNSEMGRGFLVDDQIEPGSNAKETSLMCRMANDHDSSPERQNAIITTSSSTVDDEFCVENTMNDDAAGRAWLSSLAEDIPTCRAKDVIAPPEEWLESQNAPEKAPQLLLGVDGLCSHLDSWDAIKLQGQQLEAFSNYGSGPLNDWQQPCPTQMITRDEDDGECTGIHEDHSIESQINCPCKLCPAFVSPWFSSKAHPVPAPGNSPDGSLDWSGGEATDTGDMDAHGLDNVGLRPESESNRVRSRLYWNGDLGDSGRNVRQRIEDLPHENIIANELLDNYDGFGPGDNLTRWFPQPGDIMITKRRRQAGQLSPGGHVTLYKDPEFFFYTGEARRRRITQHDFGDGDFVIRLGKFTEDWKWHPMPSIEAFLCDLRQVRPWWLVGRTYNSELQPPEYQFDLLRAPVNAVDRNFHPREGDLVVRAVPGEYNWGLYWWTHYFNFSPCDLVLRAGYEVRANGTCMVVELYYRELDDRDWSFRGRDVWTYLQVRPPPDMPLD